MPKPARIQASDVMAMRSAGIRPGEIARQLQVSQSYVSSLIRQASREGLYSAVGDPIGWDQKDIIERDRSRQAVLRELELLRSLASSPAYG